jgi:hypothetical protein
MKAHMNGCSEGSCGPFDGGDALESLADVRRKLPVFRRFAGRR